MVQYKVASTQEQITQILALQQANLATNVSLQEAKQQGFVTVQHSAELLWEMNQKHPHSIAVDNNQVVGYALVMTQVFKSKIPILEPMFNQLDHLSFRNQSLQTVDYFIMGQICVAKSHRGESIAVNMYREMQQRLAKDFQYIITEVATRNWRSMRAHEKVGFELLHQYTDPRGEEWALIIWEI